MTAYAYRRYRPPARYRYRGSRRTSGRDVVIAVVIAGVLASGATSKAARGAVFHAAAAGITGPAPAGGTLSCHGLEALWQSAGGSRRTAFMAAEIAMAESGGRQYATDLNGGRSTDRGYWQINDAAWGSLSTYDPAGNARAAVQISHDGTNWGPWTTYQSGAYAGRC